MTSAIEKKRKEKKNKVSGNEGGTKNNWGFFFKDLLSYIINFTVWFLLGSSVLNAVVSNQDFTDFYSSNYPRSMNVNCSLSDWMKNVWGTSWGNTKLTMKNILGYINNSLNAFKSKTENIPMLASRGSWYIEAVVLLLGPLLIFASKFIGLFTGYFYTLEASWCFSDYLFKFIGILAGAFFLGPFFSLAQAFGLALKLIFFVFTIKNTGNIINTFKKFKGIIFGMILLSIILSMSVNLKPIFLYVTLGIVALFIILDLLFPLRKKKLPQLPVNE